MGSLRLRTVAAVALVALVSSGCAWIARVSVDSAGTQANGSSFTPAISADGRYITFYSSASNLVAGDTNNTGDVFVRDTVTGATTRVSVDSAGTQANDSSGSALGPAPGISADGRYIAFESSASNLVAGDTNGWDDVFVRDTVGGTTTRVSVDSAGTQANWPSFSPAISADGRYITFSSIASNLVAGDTNSARGVFVRDTVGGTTTRVSVDSAGTQANSHSGSPAISADGRYVAFSSRASNLVAGDTNADKDVFVRDTVGGTTTRVSVDSAGTEASGGTFGSYHPAISADGRYITFSSEATNLVAGDTNSETDVFVRDTVGGTTTRVSVDSAGTQANDSSGSTLGPAPGISADGRYIAFESSASNLVAGDTNTDEDVFVRDTVAGTTTRVSVDSAGTQANSRSSEPVISADGRYVAFSSYASNLVAGDTNGTWEVFVKANPQPVITGVAPGALPRGVTTPVTVTGTGFLSGAILVVTGDGITLTNVVLSATEITADVTVDAGATTSARNIFVELLGTGPGPATGAIGLCSACVTVT